MTQKSQTTKRTTVISIRMKNDAVTLLNEISAQTGITKNAIITNAIEFYILKQNVSKKLK